MMQRPGRASIVKKKRGSRDGGDWCIWPCGGISVEAGLELRQWCAGVVRCECPVGALPRLLVGRRPPSLEYESSRARERWARNRHAAQKHHVGASKKESSSRPNRAKRMNAKGQLCPSATGEKAKLDFWLGSRYPATEATCAERERERGSFPLELGWKCEELQLQHRSPRAKG